MKTKAALFVTVLSMLGCNNGEPQDHPARPEGEPLYVDVRTAHEFATGHIDGALNIPHDQMEMRYGELERYRHRRIVVYCRSGRRSEVARVVLREHGFPFVENGGGYTDLVNAGRTAAH